MDSLQISPVLNRIGCIIQISEVRFFREIKYKKRFFSESQDLNMH